MYKAVIRPVLFKMDPEKAHHLAFNLLQFLQFVPGVSACFRATCRVKDKSLEREVFGLRFPNPVGLAAGFDKDARVFKAMGDLGFGFVEIGTLTPLPQPGNPRPRLFRLKEDKALINRMGFNNKGVEAAVKRLRKRRPGLIIGGNIGKNKITPNEMAFADYEKCFDALFHHVDYFAVNVSSPNTPNLRELQGAEALKGLLGKLEALNRAQVARKPILLKIAPDLNDSQLAEVVDAVRQSEIDGIIATNTTIDRKNLKSPPEKLEQIGQGGLSGQPLRARSTEVVRTLCRLSGGNIPIIAAGGIGTAEDVREKLDAGASLVQVYSGFIYEGPAMVKRILKKLISLPSKQNTKR